jgi:hypothetical protein
LSPVVKSRKTNLSWAVSIFRRFRAGIHGCCLNWSVRAEGTHFRLCVSIPGPRKK